MTDLDATSAGTRSCPACGAQNVATAPMCARCGADLDGAATPDAGRGDLELEEAWRAVAAEGYDNDFELTAESVTCTVCGAETRFDGALVRWWAARDTATAREDIVVAAVRCGSCGAQGRVEAVADTLDLVDRDADVAEGEVEWRHPPPRGSTSEHPLGEDRRFFEPARAGRLVDQRPLLDEEGEDIRQYTGEPVETEEGWVLPQQQNVGPGNEAGGGEWPDPATPSAMPKDGDAD